MALHYTYVASDNTAANGTALGVAGSDILVLGIVFGNPADGKITTLYNITNPVNGATTNIAAKVTQPTAAAGKQYVNYQSFGEGLRLGEGGNVITDGSQVTVVWKDVDDSES